MSKYTLKTWMPFGLAEDALEVRIAYSYSPGRPAVMYLRNGDPGYPADPADVDFISARLVHHTLDDSMQKMLDDWAIEFLASDDGWQKAVDNASDDSERDYDRALDAYERRTV